MPLAHHLDFLFRLPHTFASITLACHLDFLFRLPALFIPVTQSLALVSLPTTLGV
jgi:hypothetical protein